MITLTGITWNHTRGYLPMVATAQRFSEMHPDVEIRWEKRSLQEFADLPIQKLAETFDLLVIDHPFVGYAAAHPCLLPLDEHLPNSFFDNQTANSVGQSHFSYIYGGHQWALAIDAATPVASWRPDLLERPPRTWEEILELAHQGRVAAPGIPIDCLMHFYMLCIWQGEEPFQSPSTVVSKEVGAQALEHLHRLHALCSKDCFERSPIRTYEAMGAGDRLWYCPFAYGYSNYARDGYARHRLQFGDLVENFSSTLGGTGLAISLRCRRRELALEYARFVADAECQRGLYVQSGGQPGHRGAWLDNEANHMTHHYFYDTLPALDRAYLRPRYNGYLYFQDDAGPVVQEFLRKDGNVREVLRKLDAIYARSQKAAERSNVHVSKGLSASGEKNVRHDHVPSQVS